MYIKKFKLNKAIGIMMLIVLSACTTEPSIQITINFETNGGTVVESITHDGKQAVEIPDNPTKEGYVFSGWYWDNEIFERVFTAQSLVFEPTQNDLTVYAKWAPLTYIITYFLDGGTNDEENPVAANTGAILTIKDPTKEGHTFDGWYLDQQLTNIYALQTMPAEQITLYAKWQVNSYTLQYLNEDGTVLKTNDYEFGFDLSDIIEPEAHKTGHTFKGWDQVLPLTMPTTNIILRPTFTINQYTLTFQTNGGSNVEALTQDYDSEISVPAEPIKEGHTFIGWYLDEALTEAFTDHKMPAEDITLYAQWQINSYTISFVDYDNTILQSTPHEYDAILDILTPPDHPTRTGYTFLEWSVIPVKMPASDVVIRAIYDVNQYTISFIVNGGTPIEDAVYDYQALVQIPETDKEGYVVEGWYLDEALTNRFDFLAMPAENITLYANWQLKIYEIIYHLNGGINHIDNPTSFNYKTGNFIYKSATKGGHTFSGWYLEQDYSGEKIQFFVTGTTKDIHLFAKWTVNPYDVNYYIYKDYDPTSITLHPGETILSIASGASHSSALTSAGRLFTWGLNSHGQLGDGTTTNRLKPIEITSQFNLEVDEKIVSITLGANHSSALTSKGRIFIWGLNIYGQLGDASVVNKTTPIEITESFSLLAEETILYVSLGEDHSSALTSTGRIFTWGRNIRGQLGDGTTTNRNTPREITARFSLSANETITHLTLGASHSSALTSRGRLFTWGFNNSGQIGDGTLANKTTPTEITARFNLNTNETILSVSLGATHSSALTSTGRLFTWGLNSSGQIGDGTILTKTTPIEITSRFDLSTHETIIITSLGASHSSALTSTGRIFTWGGNVFGQLGDGTTIHKITPTEITNHFNLATDVKMLSLSSGYFHSLTLTTTGRIFTWGRNQYGQLGDGTVNDIFTPMKKHTNYSEFILTDTYDYGSTMAAYEPIEMGYNFSGWYKDIQMTSPYLFDIMPANDFILIGYWVLIDYEISYHLNGGINSTENPLQYTIEADTIEIIDPSKEGHTFIGWYVNEAFTGDAITAILEGTTGDLILYAKWEINAYTLSFEENGGSLVEDVIANFGTALAQPINPTRQGYHFDGWYTNTTLTNLFTFTTMPAQDLTLYAKWNPRLNIVTYVLNNGNEDFVKADYSGSALLKPTYDGFKFGGWYLDQALTQPYESDAFPTLNTTLYAKWHQIYTITYHLNGGINNISNPINYTAIDDTITLHHPFKEGHAFLGWYGHPDFTGDAITTILQGSTENITLYAKWQINPYTINYYIYEDYDLIATIILYPDETITSISLGANHSSVLTSLGRMFTWGSNGSGQLGDGTTTQKNTPQDITHQFNLAADEMIISISSGVLHASALTSKGRIFTWGSNNHGQLGDGTTTNKSTPIDITHQFNLDAEETFVRVSLKGNQAFVLTSTGRMFTWGSNVYGQLGDGTTVDKSVPIEITSQFTLELGETIANVSLGANHSAVLTSTGRMFTWGWNNSGRLGDGTTVSRSIPTEITNQFNLAVGEKITHISLGGNHSSALTSTGRMLIWGLNSHGQLGEGTTTNRSTPIEITSRFNLAAGEKITLISLGANHSSALTSLGRMLTWGLNNSGQLGDGTIINRTLPTEITNQFNLIIGEKVASVSLGDLHSAILTTSARILTWGLNSSGQLGDGATTNKSNPFEIKTYNPQLALDEIYEYGASLSEHTPINEGHTFSGWYQDIELKIPYVFSTMPAENIKLYAKWTINLYDINYYIYEDYDPLSQITLFPGESIMSISLGDLHSSALTSLGRVFTWGQNIYGQLGDGTATNRWLPIEITNQFHLEADEIIVSVSLGANHSSALTSLGRIFTWGLNNYGQLGDGTTTQKTTPQDITQQFNLTTDETIVDIASGELHASALTSKGRIFSWGLNNYGQLGDGTTTNKSTPTEITHRFNLGAEETIVRVFLGGNHSSAITSSSRVFTWGYNMYGQLGDGTTVDRLAPIETTSQFTLEISETITNISLGANHSAVLTSAGRMFTWGWNNFGQLGDGTTVSKFIPTEITNQFNFAVGEKITHISLGANHSSALTSTGRIFTWGWNNSGQLGEGTTTNRSTPIEITSRFNLAAGEKIASISLGSNHSSALTSSGHIFTWGLNNSGRLGDGTTANKLTPTKVTTNYSKLVKSESLEYGSPISAHTPSAKQGFTFSGWYTDIYRTTPYTFSTMPAEDIVLYGFWIRND